MGTSGRIDLSEYADLFPEEGHRVRVNHNDCPAGLDTRLRLEIKRKENGDVICYCHHCSGWGIERIGMVRSIHKRPVSPGIVTASTPYTLPSDIELDPTAWPKEARRWPMMYGITDDELRDNHISYSPSLKRIVIPCYSEDRNLLGYQTRRLFDDDTKPKYLTYARRGAKYFLPSRGKASGLPYLCLVEDALSAIKLSRIVSHPVAVLGSDLSSVELCGILSSCEKDITNIFLMFDNDNPHVKANQLKVLRRLDMLSPNTKNSIVYLDKDPKEYTTEELKLWLL